MSSTDTNRRIPSTATVLIALALAFLAAIAMAACAPADLPTAPDSEEAFPIASASAREGSPTLTEGGKAETTWSACPSQAMDGVACSVGPDGYATLYSTDDNIVEGDRVFTRNAIPLKSGGRVNSTITVEDDDIAYLSIRSRVTGSSWTQRSDYSSAKLWARLVCEDWHLLTSNPNLIPSLCSTDYEYIWKYLGTQSGRYPCTSAASIIAYAESTRRSAAFMKMIRALKPQYQRGCYTYGQTREWFASLSKPVQMTAPTGASVAAWVKPDYWTMQLARSNRFRMPMTNYLAEAGDWKLSDLVQSNGQGAVWTGALSCAKIADSSGTLTSGLNGGRGQNGYVNTNQIVLDIPDGADMCHP